MYSKTEIFNLALSALLLTKEVTDPETDGSPEARTLRRFYNIALSQTLADLDLDGTASRVTLELVSSYPNDHWTYAFKYPVNCAHFRRIANWDIIDTRDNQISKQIGVLGTQKVIFTHEVQPVAEYISTDVPLSALSPNAAMAVAYRLAILSSPLVVGKGASKLRDELQKAYTAFKFEAQEQDRLENSNFEDPIDTSEFVAARMS